MTNPIFRISSLLIGALLLAMSLPQASSAQDDGFRLEHRIFAPEVHQAVAVDAEHVYAITNQAIGKYDKETGERVDRWTGAEDGPIIHLNSGIVRGDTLFSAHSNYPGVLYGIRRDADEVVVTRRAE